MVKTITRFIDFVSEYSIKALFILFIAIPPAVLIFTSNRDKLNVINVVLGVTLALAAICFSYAKSMDQEEKREINLVLNCGRRFLLGSIMYLFSEAFRYVVVLLAESGNKSLPMEIAKDVGTVACLVLFCVTQIQVSISLFKLLKHIRIELKKYKYLK